jgi:coenzyme F420-reducing hydrogenase delta subunit/ferredoxin
VDLEFVLRAFSNGMDGVFVGGCRLGECNYITHGNYHALNMVLLCKRIMEHLGLNPNRLKIEFMSAGEGQHFAEVVDDFTKNVRELGPLGASEGIDKQQLKTRIDEIRKLVPYLKIVENEKLATRLVNKEDYASLFTKEEIECLFQNVVSYYIDPEKCQACGICFKRCPVEAIVGEKKMVHVIDQDKCIKCGTCFEACPSRFAAVQKLSGVPVPPPIPEDKRAIAGKAKDN